MYKICKSADGITFKWNLIWWNPWKPPTRAFLKKGRYYFKEWI